MTEVKHPRAIAIAKKGESCLWDMGDYLVEVCGKPSGKGQVSATATIKEVSSELFAHGYEQYSTTYLGQLRIVAATFPENARVAGITHYSHRVAGSPEVLATVAAAAKQTRRPVSGPFVNLVMKGMEADKRAKRKGVQIRAEKAADRAEKRGDKKAAERNRDRARKLKGAPRPDKTRAPKAEEVPLMVIKAKFMADSSTAKVWVKRMDKDIEPYIDELSKAFVVGCVEELLEIAELYRKLAVKLGRKHKGAHLHDVNAKVA